MFSRFTFNASHSKPTSPHVFLNTVNSPTFQKATKCNFEVIIYVQFKQIQSLKNFQLSKVLAMKYKPTIIKNIEEAEIYIKTLEPKNTRAF